MAAPYGIQLDQPMSLEALGTTQHDKGVSIRYLRDTKEDTTFAGKLMVEAFEDKFAHSVTREKLPITKRVMASTFRRQSPQFYSRHLLAEVNGQPVGYMGLKFKGDPDGGDTDELCDLGCWHACRFMCFGCVMDSDVSDRSKCLLEVVGVDSLCRGRGVGKALMDRAEQEARKAGCRTIYLMVITTNRAIHLYERQGYVIKSTDQSCLFHCVAGPPGSYHVMEKQL